MKRTSASLFVAVLSFLFFTGSSTFVSAELYKVTVTREDSNLYRVDGSSPKIYVQTKYCYVYAYSEKALIDTEDMQITFLDSDTTCKIERFLYSER